MRQICIGFLTFIPPKPGEKPDYVFQEFPLTLPDLTSGLRAFPIYRDIEVTSDEMPTFQTLAPLKGKTIAGILYPQGKDESDDEFNDRLSIISRAINGTVPASVTPPPMPPVSTPSVPAK